MKIPKSLEDIKDILKPHNENLKIYCLLFSLVFLIYYFVSSGDFSFLLTLSAFLRFFGFGLLNYKVWTEKTVAGLSVKTLEVYVLVFINRLVSILRHEQYLPFDRSGDWFYHTVEIFSLFAVCLAIYGVFKPFRATYEESNDKFGAYLIPSQLGVVYLILPCLILAIFFHPSLNKEFLADTAWTNSMYLEAVAMLPQIYMFQRKAANDKGTVEPLIGHTMFALGFSRIGELVFWLSSFTELADQSGGSMPGYVVLFSQIIHLIVMADYFYYYFRSMSKGVPMELPNSYAGANLLSDTV